MAEIIEKDSGGKKGGKVRSKKAPGRPDMTPMVDLGFLLITFFIFTTTFSKPNMMKLNLPEKDEEKKAEDQEKAEIKLSNTITIVMGKDNRLFWYQQAVADVKPEDFHETDYSAKGIRLEIEKKKQAALDSSKFTVIIKPTDEATFKNTVDILDEMEITGNKLFALVDLQQKEIDAYKEKMKTPKANN
ncbi:MAG: biopolymer transporter ExbD [Spirosomataceae bacterium]|jgi:biopolymer transport protein ExbD